MRGVGYVAAVVVSESEGVGDPVRKEVTEFDDDVESAAVPVDADVLDTVLTDADAADGAVDEGARDSASPSAAWRAICSSSSCRCSILAARASARHAAFSSAMILSHGSKTSGGLSSPAHRISSYPLKPNTHLLRLTVITSAIATVDTLK